MHSGRHVEVLVRLAGRVQGRGGRVGVVKAPVGCTGEPSWPSSDRQRPISSRTFWRSVLGASSSASSDDESSHEASSRAFALLVTGPTGAGGDSYHQMPPRWQRGATCLKKGYCIAAAAEGRRAGSNVKTALTRSMAAVGAPGMSLEIREDVYATPRGSASSLRMHASAFSFCDVSSQPRLAVMWCAPRTRMMARSVAVDGKASCFS